MRPINLIPEDERRADRGSLTEGALSWAIVGALALAVVGVIVYSTTSRTVSEREAEVAALEHREGEAQREAERLRPYTTFTMMSEMRKLTVASLAASRFDWERVMRELSLIIPDDIVLESLTATVVPGVSVPNSTSVGLRSEIEGPALELRGCGAGPRDQSQEAVAGFVSALYDIGGVTRVGVSSAEVEGNERCAGRGQSSSFEIVAAFDHAPVPGEDMMIVPGTEAPVVETDNGSVQAGGAGGGPASGPPDQHTQASTAAPQTSRTANEPFQPGG